MHPMTITDSSFVDPQLRCIVYSAFSIYKCVCERTHHTRFSFGKGYTQSYTRIGVISKCKSLRVCELLYDDSEHPIKHMQSDRALTADLSKGHAPILLKRRSQEGHALTEEGIKFLKAHVSRSLLIGSSQSRGQSCR